VARVTAKIDIDAGRREVWEVATDLGRIGEWVSIHKAFPDGPPGELVPGSRFRQTLKVAGTTFGVEWTATEIDGPRKLTWEGAGPAGSTAHTSYTLESENGGTRLIYENEFTLPAGKLGKAAARAVARQAGKQAAGSLETLKELIES
jgi:ligand-binding SRPBCC domain-containing protein